MQRWELLWITAERACSSSYSFFRVNAWPSWLTGGVPTVSLAYEPVVKPRLARTLFKDVSPCRAFGPNPGGFSPCFRQALVVLKVLQGGGYASAAKNLPHRTNDHRQ